MRGVCLVGSSEDGLRLRQRLSSVPGCTRPSSGRAFAPCLIAISRDCGFGWGALVIFVHNRRGSSSPSVVATGTVLDLLHLLRLGMGRAQGVLAFFTPTMVSSQWRLRQCGPAHGDGGEANGRNFRRRRSFLLSVSSSTAGPLHSQYTK